MENAVKDVMFCKNKRDSYVDIRGDIIKGNSQRFQTFFTKGLKCSCCGIEGKYFAKEKDRPIMSDLDFLLTIKLINV